MTNSNVIASHIFQKSSSWSIRFITFFVEDYNKQCAKKKVPDNIQIKIIPI